VIQPFEPSPDGELILGVNVTGEMEAQSFTALDEGDPLQVELGFQGSWMVVLAFRTRNHPLPLFLDVEAQLFVDGLERASAYYTSKTLESEFDGYDYFYNVFVVTSDFAEYVHSEATVALTLYDLSGAPLLETSRSILVSPPPGFVEEESPAADDEQDG
jgi:hypothetical protein